MCIIVLDLLLAYVRRFSPETWVERAVQGAWLECFLDSRCSRITDLGFEIELQFLQHQKRKEKEIGKDISAEHRAFTALSVQVFPVLSSKWFFHATVRILTCPRLLSRDNIHLRLSKFYTLELYFNTRPQPRMKSSIFSDASPDSDVHPTAAGIINFSMQLSRGNKKEKFDF